MYKKKLISLTTLILIFLVFFGYQKLSDFNNKISLQKNTIDKQKKEINKLKNDLNWLAKKRELFPKIINPLESDINLKKNLTEITYKKNSTTKIKDKNFNIYNPDKNLILRGIASFVPGSAYLEFYNDNLFLLSSIGILGYSKISGDKLVFTQIKNNIDEFIGIPQLKKRNSVSLKDLKIFNNKIFISLTNEKTKDCWNTSIIYADLNLKELKFNKLFFPEECINSLNTKDGEFDPIQSGGRIINLDDKIILLSIGDYRSRQLAQNKKSIFGKILKINIKTKEYKIFSMGHRNPQGLYYDAYNNFVLETEHGPEGGDEINLIEVNKNSIPNYGWAIASYGEHYGGKTKGNEKLYNDYPLLKSHEKNGFIEPLKSFTPSIGISEIVGLDQNNYLVSSLRDQSIYFFSLNENKKISKIEKFKLGERIRDVIYKEGKIFIFLEDSVSIGIIDWK
ncbi:PQQ-dependent sugar dehydrogenase [Pelagibacterales bacterium SAG-MED03]|nr:PQQ-dependent sugar dehydrogenase [Pelagibacterales bacterium SAG-MED03]